LRSCLVPSGTGVKLALIFLAAYIASFMTEGMTPISCYAIVGFDFIDLLFF